MYNLLVTYKVGEWEKGNYEIDASRFLEYTNERIASKFRPLSLNQKILLNIPSLFAYEGKTEPYRVGVITEIQERGKKIYIKYKIDKEIEPISFEIIEELATMLDIREFEKNRTHWAIKDEDLGRILESKNIVKGKKVIDNKESTTLKKDKNDSSIITSITGYIKKIFDIEKIDNREIFYRGHSDKTKYKLEPSILRKDESGNYLYLQNEELLYQELLVSNSGDFKDDMCTLDKIVRMQHYSLPTRLLDITSNPLVSLYFACCSNTDKDGEVIIFNIEKQMIKYFDSDTASCIANLARLSIDEKNKINFQSPKFNEDDSIRKLIHFIKEEKSCFMPNITPLALQKIICVKSKMTNSRILSQSGAFLLFGHDRIMDEQGIEGITIVRITIKNKEKILSQLDTLNINEKTVFPYIEHSAKYIREKFRLK